MKEDIKGKLIELVNACMKYKEIKMIPIKTFETVEEPDEFNLDYPYTSSGIFKIPKNERKIGSFKFSNIDVCGGFMFKGRDIGEYTKHMQILKLKVKYSSGDTSTEVLKHKVLFNWKFFTFPYYEKISNFDKVWEEGTTLVNADNTLSIDKEKGNKIILTKKKYIIQAYILGKSFFAEIDKETYNNFIIEYKKHKDIYITEELQKIIEDTLKKK